MEKPVKIVAQIYGYSVCLVAVITFLICTTTLVTAIIDSQDPLHSGWNPTPSVVSFENYKADVLKSYQRETENNKALYIPSEQSLHTMYEAARNDKILYSTHQSNKSILMSSLILLICITLFFTHWRWMKNLSATVL